MTATIDQDRSEALRTCAGCRSRDARDALLRFAIRADEPRLVPDPQRRLPGRGVSVHPTRRCVEAAVRKGGLARALRAPVGVSPEALCALAASRYAERVRGLLLAASRHKVLALGTGAVRDAIRQRVAQLVLVASDAAGRREEIEAAAERLDHRVVVFGTKAGLGAVFGRAELGVLAVLDAGIAREVAATAARAKALLEAT